MTYLFTDTDKIMAQVKMDLNYGNPEWSAAILDGLVSIL